MKRKLKEEGLNADLKQEELFNKLLDNSQNDIECTLQLLDIIQNELFLHSYRVNVFHCNGISRMSESFSTNRIASLFKIRAIVSSFSSHMIAPSSGWNMNI